MADRPNPEMWIARTPYMSTQHLDFLALPNPNPKLRETQISSMSLSEQA
jgi:hypothetical protein